MTKHDNFQVNFSLKGLTSIQIGIYILIASYVIKTMIDGFLIDNNPFGMLSAEILEMLIISIVVSVLLFSSVALFFKGRRASKRFQFQLWNGTTKKALAIYIFSFTALFVVLYLLMSKGFIDFLTPTFLILYGFILLILKNKTRKNLLVISGICFLLAAMCFLIPTYWYSSLVILGIAHCTYGIVVK